MFIARCLTYIESFVIVFRGNPSYTSEQMVKNKSPVDISIIVTCHKEGIILHRTLRSIYQATTALNADNITFELILHVDNPDSATEDYIANSQLLENVFVYRNSFGDPGAARNFSIKKAKGKYITFIDADDLMSPNWLIKAYNDLESRAYGQYVAHTEATLEFGDFTGIVQKHSEINKDTDALLSVWAGRWNAVIFAPSSIFKRIDYPINSPGYGFEDWLFSCLLIWNDVHNIVIPETVIFVRRKSTDSVWNTHRSSLAVLPANPLMAFDYVRKNKTLLSTVTETGRLNELKNIIKNSRFDKVGRKLYKVGKNAARLRIASNTTPAPTLPSWLITEWRNAHSIENNLFPSSEALQQIKIYDSLTKEHFLVGEAYRSIVSHTTTNKYDYLLFVPWVIKGGADLFSINYATNIAKLRSSKKVAVIATVSNVTSTWSSKLPKNVDFIPFGNITQDLEPSLINKLLEQFIENSRASYIHIFNSEVAYNFVKSHSSYITGSKKTVIATSFSQSTDESGRVFGYSHTHVPDIYELASIITTDNATVAKMWNEIYGFSDTKIRVHRQPIRLPDLPPPTANRTKPIRILWASRLAPEKIPELVPEIARLLDRNRFVIDMYGSLSDEFDSNTLKSMPKNIAYKGEFDGFTSLNPQSYDLFLYTSLFDGMPNILLEASSHKMPIITSSVGGIPELIKDNFNGLLVEDIRKPEEYAKRIIALADDYNLRSTLAKNAYERIASEYSKKAYEDSIEEMLQTINY